MTEMKPGRRDKISPTVILAKRKIKDGALLVSSDHFLELAVTSFLAAAFFVKKGFKKMKKSPLILPLLLSLTILAGCSTKSFDNTKLIVGVECAYAPFNWVDDASNDTNAPISNHSGQYADGFDIQIAKRLSEEMNKPLVIVQTPWESLIPDLQSGSINCIISGMTDTSDREMTIDFSNEYYRSELVLITQKSVADDNPTALSKEAFGNLIKDKVVVSQRETATNDMIDIFAETYGAIHATPVSTFPLAAIDVENGSAFAMTAELPVAKAITASMTDLGIVHIDQTILGDQLSKLGVSVGIQKGNTELRDAINSTMASWSDEWRLSTMESALARSGGAE